MTNERCMELLNGIINYVSAAHNTYDTLYQLICMGYQPNELVTVFGFDKDDVDPVVKDYESEK